jgi:hypothetical protein
MFDARERHERLAGRALTHAAMANARMLGRREQSIADGAALTAAGPGPRPTFVVGARHDTSQMTFEIHALVQNANNFDSLLQESEKNHMRTDRILTITWPNMIA